VETQVLSGTKLSGDLSSVLAIGPKYHLTPATAEDDRQRFCTV